MRHSNLANTNRSHPETDAIGSEKSLSPWQLVAHHVRPRERGGHKRFVYVTHHVLSAGDLWTGSGNALYVSKSTQRSLRLKPNMQIFTTP